MDTEGCIHLTLRQRARRLGGELQIKALSPGTEIVFLESEASGEPRGFKAAEFKQRMLAAQG